MSVIVGDDVSVFQSRTSFLVIAVIQGREAFWYEKNSLTVRGKRGVLKLYPIVFATRVVTRVPVKPPGHTITTIPDNHS